MKKATTLILALVLAAFAVSSASAAGSVRISQVYGGGGGTTTSTYLFDYVELFNSSGAPVNIGGWSLQYGSSTGSSFASSAINMALIPAGASIPACGYYLCQVGSSGSAGVALPVTPDQVTTGPAMGASAGKVALVSNQVFPHPCSGSSIGGDYVDVVGYGAANCFEGTGPVATLSSTTVAVRKLAGLQDTDINSADFVAQGTNITTLHNSLSPANIDCLATPTMPSTWGKIKVLYR
jgi:hypothetical protein